MAVSRLSQQSLQQAFPKGNTVWDGITATGAMDAISVVNVPSSGLASVEFNNIPQTYTHLRLYALSRTSNGDFNDMIGSFNGDAGTTYSWHRIIANGATVASGGGASTTKFVIGVNSSPTQTSGVFASNVVDILDYTSTSKTKVTRSLTGTDNNGSGYVIFYSGAWYNPSSAITTINLTPQSGAGSFVQYSSFVLYGIR